MKLVLGTHNQNKRIELADLLRPYDLQVVSLADVDSPLSVVEDGDTFAENAAKKASQQAIHLGLWTIGEDSGLCVDALQGAPGIYSARYAGPEATDDSNIDKLIEALQGVPREKRSAHYVSHICLSDPQGEIRVACEARCHGRLRDRRYGTGGFGYDPLFEIPELDRTFGELQGAAKSVLSHRARAMRRFIPQLLATLNTAEVGAGGA